MLKVLILVCLSLANQCQAENVIWKDGKCRVKGNPPKYMMGQNGGYSGYCPPDRFYINPRTPCKHCPGSGTNCCENTFHTCLHDKNINGSCDWAKNVTTSTATPKSQKPKISTILPKDTSEAPCETSNETFYVTTANIMNPLISTSNLHSPTPTPITILPTDHDFEDHTTTQKTEEASTSIQCWVVGGVIVFGLAVVLALVIKHWDDVVTSSREFMRSIRQRSYSDTGLACDPNDPTTYRPR